MLSLADQIRAAGEQAMREAAAVVRGQAEWQERRARGLAPRRAGLSTIILARLPASAEEAVDLKQIRELLAGVDYADGGLTAALSYMSNAKQISRIGEKSSYRYWKP